MTRTIVEYDPEAYKGQKSKIEINVIIRSRMYDLMGWSRRLVDAWTKDRVSGCVYTIVRVNDRVETLIFISFYDRKSQEIMRANASV